MSRRHAPSHARRSKRYVLLLTPDELALAKTAAAREFRPLPDFFRRHIYESAAKLGLPLPSPERSQQFGPLAEATREQEDATEKRSDMETLNLRTLGGQASNV